MSCTISSYICIQRSYLTKHSTLLATYSYNYFALDTALCIVITAAFAVRRSEESYNRQSLIISIIEDGISCEAIGK